MKQPERIVWIAVVIGTITWSVMSKEGSHAEPAVRDQASSKATRSHDRLSNRGGDSPQGGRAVRASVRARGLHALRSSDPLLRMAEFLKILSSCDRAGFEQVATALDELRASGISLPAEEALLNFRAGQIKGAELLEGRAGSADDIAMIDTLKKQYEGWIQANPTAAGQWLAGLPSGRFRDQMAVAYIAESTKDDPLGAMRLVSSLHPSQQASAGKAVVQRLTESATMEDASALLATLGANAGNGESSYLQGMFEALAEGAAKAGNQDALSVLDNHIDGPYVSGRLLARISEAKGKADPTAALEWAAGLEGTKMDLSEGTLLSATIGGMGLGDLDVVEEWAQGRQEWPGVAAMQASLASRRRLLEDRGDGENEYDKDD